MTISINRNPLIRQALMKPFHALLMFLFCLPTVAEQLPLPPQSHIVIEAVGELQRVPDIVELDIDIRHTASSFAEAKKSVDLIVSAAIRAALEHKVKSDDINASQIQASPQYQWQGKDKIYQGEQVSRQLHIRLNKTEHYNALVNALLESGVSRLNRSQFSFSKQAQLEKLALEQALDNARQQARAIASHMNIKLGRVYQIAPVGPVAYPRGQLMEMADSKAANADLKPGKQTIRQQIRVVYLLGDE